MDTSIIDFEMVRVVWHDAHSTDSGSWEYANDGDDDPLSVTHIGYLLPVDKGGKTNHLTLCFGVTVDGALDTRIHIPTGMVVSVERLVSDGERGLDRPVALPEKGGSSRSRRRRTVD